MGQPACSSMQDATADTCNLEIRPSLHIVIGDETSRNMSHNGLIIHSKYIDHRHNRGPNLTTA